MSDKKNASNVDAFIVILNEMAYLLAHNSGENVWASKLRSLAGKTTLHIDDLKQLIKQMYGGMGSINDLHVQLPNGDFDSEGTEKFSSLRTELYQLATYSRGAALSKELSEAIVNNDLERVKKLVKGDVDINRACNPNGWRPLHIAVEHGHHEIITVLINVGADVNIQDATGFTPLHLAVDSEADGAIQNGETPTPDISRLLLDQNADYTLKNKNGISPINLATHYQYTRFLELHYFNPVSGYTSRLQQHVDNLLAEMKRCVDEVEQIDLLKWYFSSGVEMSLSREDLKKKIMTDKKLIPLLSSDQMKDCDGGKFPPHYRIGDRVSVIVNAKNLTAHRGKIRKHTWDNKIKQWHYYLISEEGGEISKRYLLTDLEPT